jgi:hypothetical protein
MGTIGGGRFARVGIRAAQGGGLIEGRHGSDVRNIGDCTARWRLVSVVGRRPLTLAAAAQELAKHASGKDAKVAADLALLAFCLPFACIAGPCMIRSTHSRFPCLGRSWLQDFSSPHTDLSLCFHRDQVWCYKYALDSATHSFYSPKLHPCCDAF